MGDYLAWILHAHAHLTVCVGNWFAPFRPTDSLNIGRRYGKQVYTLKIITIPEYFKPTITVLNIVIIIFPATTNMIITITNIIIMTIKT